MRQVYIISIFEKKLQGICSSSSSSSFLVSFIYFVGERVGKGQRERERGRERIPSRLRAVSKEPGVGLDLTYVRS